MHKTHHMVRFVLHAHVFHSLCTALCHAPALLDRRGAEAGMAARTMNTCLECWVCWCARGVANDPTTTATTLTYVVTPVY